MRKTESRNKNNKKDMAEIENVQQDGRFKHNYISNYMKSKSTKNYNEKMDTLRIGLKSKAQLLIHTVNVYKKHALDIQGHREVKIKEWKKRYHKILVKRKRCDYINI